MRSLISAVAALVAIPAFADEKPAARELELKDVKLVRAQGFDDPPTVVEIKTAADLAKSAVFADDASRELVKKQVDFTNEKLVVISWIGSSAGSVSAKEKTSGKQTTVMFTPRSGPLLDLYKHVRVYAVPKDAEVKLVTPQ